MNKAEIQKFQLLPTELRYRQSEIRKTFRWQSVAFYGSQYFREIFCLLQLYTARYISKEINYISLRENKLFGRGSKKKARENPLTWESNSYSLVPRRRDKPWERG